MKKILALFFALCIIIEYIMPLYGVAATQEDNYFVVTAYYSPLPDQEYYLTGNYEDEIILNGRWIAGASWKNVFSGMLAAPKKYSFWTKVYLDGLGVWSIEDRGWAIVPAGKRWYEHDRIDVWMGYGDEWLRRALFWGKRKVYGYPVKSTTPVSIDYTEVPSPLWAIKWLQKTYKKTLIDIFNTSINRWSDEALINELQDVLRKLGYFDWENTGIYDETTINAVYDFQIEYNIVKTSYERGAWSYGPKTRKELSQRYQSYLEEEVQRQEFLAKIDALQAEALQQAQSHIASLERPVYGEISPRVREFQKTLSTLWFFEHKDTAIFGVKTQNALLSYQIEKNIITDSSDLGAWIFWPQTRAQFIQDLQNIYFLESLEKQELLVQYNKYSEKAHITIKDTHTDDISLEDISFKI